MEKNFASILKKIMADRKLNQLQLAGILGIRQSQISNWLNEKTLPNYESLDLMSKKLNISVNQLFGN